MYEQFYGFRTKPFSILPDSDFLYRSRGHRLALSTLEYGLGSQTGFTVITGEIGSGKTTLLQYLLKNTDPSHTIGYVTNTAELNKDLMKWILYAFNLHTSGESDVDYYQTFVEFVKRKYAEGRDCVLIIDEAQLLAASTLESIRLLSNINVGRDHILKMLLVGQPELLSTLADPDLVQFAQRVSAHFHLEALSLMETREYIRTRLRIAGGTEALFDYASCDLIFAFSGGVPRQINILCDTALVYGYADGRQRIDLDTVIGVLRDRSVGKSIGGINVPERFDRAAAEAITRAAREREIEQEIDPSSPIDVGGLASAAATDQHALSQDADRDSTETVGQLRSLISDNSSYRMGDPLASADERSYQRRALADLDRGPDDRERAALPRPGLLDQLPRAENARIEPNRVRAETQLTLFHDNASEQKDDIDLGRALPAKGPRVGAGPQLHKPFQVYPASDQSNSARQFVTANLKDVDESFGRAREEKITLPNRRRWVWLVAVTLVIAAAVFFGSRGLSFV